MTFSRRQFLKTGLAGLALPAFNLTAYRQKKTIQSSYHDRKMLFGWTTCLTYQTGNRKLGFDYFSQLLDEMQTYGMRRLIVMMESHGVYSPGNHGIAWPVKNPRLKPQLDRNAVNPHEETEFFSKIIQKAHNIGIEVFIEIKYLGLVGIREGYPAVEFLTNSEGGYLHDVPPEASDFEREAIQTLHLCCDSDAAHQYMRDKIQDVLERYNDLDGIVLEHPSYFDKACYCASSRQKLLQATGKDIAEVSTEILNEWKNIRIRDTLINLKQLIHRINPKFQFGFYTGFSPANGDVAGYQCNRGHSIETLKQVGFDFVMPYCEGRHKEHEIKEVEKVVAYLAPLKIYLHTTIRKEPPKNYPLPPKDPKYIKNIIHWGKEYFNQNERFIGMTFFNEVKIPDENRQAVYDSI